MLPSLENISSEFWTHGSWWGRDNHFLTALNETLSCKRATLRFRGNSNDVALNFKGQDLDGLHYCNNQAQAIFFTALAILSTIK